MPDTTGLPGTGHSGSEMGKAEEKALDWFEGRDPRRAGILRETIWYGYWNHLADLLSKGKKSERHLLKEVFALVDKGAHRTQTIASASYEALELVLAERGWK